MDESMLKKRMWTKKKLSEYINSFLPGTKDRNLADVINYNDYAHFISLFKQVYGMNPKEYRKQNNTDYGYDYAQM